MSTDLYFLRHGIAFDREDPNCPPDFERPLTAEGRSQLAAAVDGMRLLGIRFDTILTSPLVRAMQTAELVAELMPGRVMPEPCRALSPGFALRDVLPRLRACAPDSSILLVGHQPDFSEVVCEMIGARSSADLRFKPATLAGVRVKDFRANSPGGKLLLLLPPEMLADAGNRAGPPPKR